MAAPAIAIIGGGPCGLTLARLLECKGIDYAVYERDDNENSNRDGGSLDLHPETGQHALLECGLFDEFRKYARYDDTVFSIKDKLGKRLLEIGQGRDAPEIDRSRLRQILLDAVPKGKIKWGYALKSVTSGEDNKPILKFANGTVLSGFKLVVGTDGAWSKVRPMITQAKPQYTGKSFLVSKINHENPLHATIARSVGAGSSLSIGSGKFILVQRQGDGSYRTSFGLPVPETFFRNDGSGDSGSGSGGVDLQDLEATRRLLLSDFFADWSHTHRDLILHGTDPRAWPLYALAAEDMSWTSVPGITLGGDAAHVAFPGGGGVNTAMADAVQLAAKIAAAAEHGGLGSEDLNFLDRAVGEYEAEMFARGVAVIAEGEAMAGVMCGEDPEAFLRLVGS